MAKKLIFHDINVVTCEGCNHIEPIEMHVHGYCRHPRVKMAQVINEKKRCIWRQDGEKGNI